MARPAHGVEARSLCQDALQAADQGPRSQIRWWCDAWVRIARIAGLTGDPQTAISLFRKVDAELETLAAQSEVVARQYWDALTEMKLPVVAPLAEHAERFLSGVFKDFHWRIRKASWLDAIGRTEEASALFKTCYQQAARHRAWDPQYDKGLALYEKFLKAQGRTAELEDYRRERALAVKARPEKLLQVAEAKEKERAKTEAEARKVARANRWWLFWRMHGFIILYAVFLVVLLRACYWFAMKE